MNDMTANSSPLSGLLDALRGLIQQGRHRALRAVDMVQVQACWEIGRHLVEFEQGGQARGLWQAAFADTGTDADHGVRQGVRRL